MKKIATIFVALYLFAVMASAQWDGAAWPSWGKQRTGSILANNCYSAIVERTTVLAGVADPAAPTFWRSQRANLSQCKTRLKTIIPYFVDASEASYTNTWDGRTTNWNFDLWFSTTNGFTNFSEHLSALSPVYLSTAYLSRTSFPVYSVTGLLWDIKAPTNYLDYTPWRCLNGKGPFDSDATVGHGHGWTNSDTVNGGTNYPAGRTNWYTTDYGWAYMKDVINKLVWTYSVTNLVLTNQIRHAPAFPSPWYYTNICESYTNANLEWASRDYTNVIIPTKTYEAGWGYDIQPAHANSNAFGIYRKRAWPELLGVSVAFDHEVQNYWYFNAAPQDYSSHYGQPIKLSDADYADGSNDDFVVTAEWRNRFITHAVWTNSSSAGYTNIGMYYTNTSYGATTNVWSENPLSNQFASCPALGSDRLRLYYAGVAAWAKGGGTWYHVVPQGDFKLPTHWYSLWLIKWDITNGFEYVK